VTKSASIQNNVGPLGTSYFVNFNRIAHCDYLVINIHSILESGHTSCKSFLVMKQMHDNSNKKNSTPH